jgi:secreted trypsin-like serine protease
VIARLTLVAVAVALACAAPAAAAKPRAPLIVGGTAAPAGAWPSIAFLEGRYSDPAGQEHVYDCTGSVVAPEWIITAGHCAFGNPGQPPEVMHAILGVTNSQDPSGQVVAIDRLVPDPAFDPTQDVEDLAMLHLAQPVTTPPIRLATSADFNAGRYVSDPNVPNAAGWGAVDQNGSQFTTALQQAYLEIWPASQCSAAISGFDSSTQACAGTPGKAGACFGDSGGPLVMLDAANRQQVLWGVTSYRPEQGDDQAPCSLSQPAVFTWIPAFADFIHSTLATTPGPAPQPVSNPVPKPAGAGARRSLSCRRATAHLAAVRRTERTLLRQLRAARRQPAGQDGRRRLERATRRYRDAQARHDRAASTMRRACRSTA